MNKREVELCRVVGGICEAARQIEGGIDQLSLLSQRMTELVAEWGAEIGVPASQVTEALLPLVGSFTRMRETMALIQSSAPSVLELLADE
jgi:hypothetical protein